MTECKLRGRGGGGGGCWRGRVLCCAAEGNVRDVFVAGNSFQFKMACMRSEKPIFEPSLRSFPNVAFQTVPMFV